MNEGQARTLGALNNGALTAAEVAKHTAMSREQVGEHLRHLASIGFVSGNTARPRVWAMTGRARGWATTSIGRSALESQA